MTKPVRTTLMAGLGLIAVAGAAEAASMIRCPLDSARRSITNPLPPGWWTTPSINRLSKTDIRVIGGKRTLICRYGPSGNILHMEPPGQRCTARAGGFHCAAATPPGAGAPGGGTFSSKALDVPQTYTFDLDRGGVGGQGADVWFEAETASLLYLTPRNGAKLGVGNRSNRGYAGCRNARLSPSRVSLRDVPVGSYVCARSNEGRVSQFRINRVSPVSPRTLSIGYTTRRAR